MTAPSDVRNDVERTLLGRRPNHVAEFPKAITSEWVDDPSFSAALRLHVARHGDTLWGLHNAVVFPGEKLSRGTIAKWAAGVRPSTPFSREILGRIERRYGLPLDYLLRKLNQDEYVQSPRALNCFSPHQWRRVKWHIPQNFDTMSPSLQEEVITWIHQDIVVGGTDYREYHIASRSLRYSLQMPDLASLLGRPRRPAVRIRERSRYNPAPPSLITEITELLRYKTQALTPIGSKRGGRWSDATARHTLEQLGLMFGALCADSGGELGGLNLPKEAMSLALLVLPDIWDWYLAWRFQRRGFYTRAERDLVGLVQSLTCPDIGWMWQTPSLAKSLKPVPGLLDVEAVEKLKSDWRGGCEAMHHRARALSKDIKRVCRVHRDPFEPIHAILVSESPVGEYRRITSEIVAQIPCSRRYPRSAAEVVRGLLMLRFGLHLGLRQQNLRELLICRKGDVARTLPKLEMLKRGELRWCGHRKQWECLIPAVAFKNSGSSFFNNHPFRMYLVNVEDLYDHIDAYLTQHRRVLLGGAEDPGTFFVRTMRSTHGDASYTGVNFYCAWRTMIERYGVYNPYTGRGAIKGLLPHGPHSVRDVLATHILKKTGSYDQASYAIQDTAETVARSYGRFAPEEKSRMAAKILDLEWTNKELSEDG